MFSSNRTSAFVMTDSGRKLAILELGESDAVRRFDVLLAGELDHQFCAVVGR